MKLGIFGGSFNPPHVAHLILAEVVYEELFLDLVLFVPSANPPHKEGEKLLEPELRLHLTRLAVADNKRFAVSDTEIRRKGTSYTIETIRELETMYEHPTLYLIVGADNLLTFHQWREYRSIMDRCTLVALRRPGFGLTNLREEILSKTIILEVPYLEVSSTEIRNRIQQGKSVRYMVPDAVLHEIEKRRLYKNG